uniref:Uncharacterized protein n=1 Tax=Opuntia streptacantha TaxID=393608 RepID=A0A7C9E5B2_OPUST
MGLTCPRMSLTRPCMGILLCAQCLPQSPDPFFSIQHSLHILYICLILIRLHESLNHMYDPLSRCHLKHREYLFVLHAADELNGVVVLAYVEVRPATNSWHLLLIVFHPFSGVLI